MIKDKHIKTLLPFVVVVLSTFFLADADLFENFGSRLVALKNNIRLLWMMNTADTLQAAASLIISWVFFWAWIKNRHSGMWYLDLLWQLSGFAFCWFLLSLFSLVGTFYLYLWINGMLKLLIAIFSLYISNTIVTAKEQLYYPDTPEEMIEKRKAFERLTKEIEEFRKTHKIP